MVFDSNNYYFTIRFLTLPKYAAVWQKGCVEKDEKGRGEGAVHRRQVRRQRPTGNVSTYQIQ